MQLTGSVLSGVISLTLAGGLVSNYAFAQQKPRAAASAQPAPRTEAPRAAAPAQPVQHTEPRREAAREAPRAAAPAQPVQHTEPRRETPREAPRVATPAQPVQHTEPRRETPREAPRVATPAQPVQRPETRREAAREKPREVPRVATPERRPETNRPVTERRAEPKPVARPEVNKGPLPPSRNVQAKREEHKDGHGYTERAADGSTKVYRDGKLRQEYKDGRATSHNQDGSTTVRTGDRTVRTYQSGYKEIRTPGRIDKVLPNGGREVYRGGYKYVESRQGNIILRNKTIYRGGTTIIVNNHYTYVDNSRWGWRYSVYHPIFDPIVYNPWYQSYWSGYGFVVWNEPVRYCWYGCGYSWGWTSYYGYYYQPAPAYASAALLLTDWVLFDILETRNQNRLKEETEAAQRDRELAEQERTAAEEERAAASEERAAIANEHAEYLRENAPVLNDQGSQIDVTLKQELAKQVQEDVAAIKEEKSPDVSDVIQSHIFAVNDEIEASTVGADGKTYSCEISDGDLIRLAPNTRLEPGNETVKMAVVTSKKESCRPGQVITVAVSQLQEMLNDFTERVQRGMKDMKDKNINGR